MVALQFCEAMQVFAGLAPDNALSWEGMKQLSNIVIQRHGYTLLTASELAVHTRPGVQPDALAKLLHDMAVQTGRLLGNTQVRVCVC